MHRAVLALLLLAAVAPLLLSERAASPTYTVSLNGQNFTLPVGFTIELVSKPELVKRPITADFDEQGRLYVADSSGSNAKVDQQLSQKPHRIVRLEDDNGDGVFDRRTIFADRMMFPEGTMWLDGSLYVAAPPDIWKLTDSNNDGIADRREVWFAGRTLTGCANDLHGPYAGPDGWIYWTKGAFAQQTYSRPGKPDLVTRAAHIFRARPDGKDIEPVMTGGMDNPVDVVFTSAGERIFTTTFLQHPGGGQRDGLIHAIYGGVYGKDHSVLDGHIRTSPALMPVLTHLGPAAPSGLHCYQSEAFGPEYRDNLFAAQFNLRKISRHVLMPLGASFTTQDSDFLVSDNHDFHPTDVLEDADGSLLVLDTGGWYKLCCPSSQLDKPDVLGAIYRIRRKDAPRLDDPWGKRIDWKGATPAQLGELLGDARQAVARRAVAELARRGSEAVPVLAGVLRKSPSLQARRNALWTAVRIGTPGSQRLVRAGLSDIDDSVRQIALHGISVSRDRLAAAELPRLIETGSPHNRRAAAEALGRIGDGRAIPSLLAALGKESDPVLRHSLLYALIEIGDVTATRRGLNSTNPRIRQAALIALDQMPAGKLEATSVIRELQAADAELQATAWWIASRHADWGKQLAEVFQTRLATASTAAQREQIVEHLSRFGKSPAIVELLATRLQDASASLDEKRLVLRSMAAAAVKPVPSAWLQALSRQLTAPSELTADLARAIRQMNFAAGQAPQISSQLRTLASHAKLNADDRLLVLAAAPSLEGVLAAPLFDLAMKQLAREAPADQRALAVEVLHRSNLSREQLLQLSDRLADAAPLEIDRLLEPFGKTSDEAVGKKLVAALKNTPARAALRADALRTRFAKYSSAIRKEADVLIDELDADVAEQKKQLEKVLGRLKPGDVRRGQAVFNSQKAACASCHAIGYVGGKIGPDLTRIGQIRNERDLLESILYPSASFVRSYEPLVVTTRGGKSFNGVLVSESPDEIVLNLSATEKVRIARGDIEEMQPGKVSIMPAGIDKVLSEQELADLVAFLKACK
jgi:putative membrane-bound dehydrogenase-like protein